LAREKKKNAALEVKVYLLNHEHVRDILKDLVACLIEVNFVVLASDSA